MLGLRRDISTRPVEQREGRKLLLPRTTFFRINHARRSMSVRSGYFCYMDYAQPLRTRRNLHAFYDDVLFLTYCAVNAKARSIIEGLLSVASCRLYSKLPLAYSGDHATVHIQFHSHREPRKKKEKEKAKSILAYSFVFTLFTNMYRRFPIIWFPAFIE